MWWLKIVGAIIECSEIGISDVIVTNLAAPLGFKRDYNLRAYHF